MNKQVKSEAEKLAAQLLKTIGKQSPIVAMNALYLAMQAVAFPVIGYKDKEAA